MKKILDYSVSIFVAELLQNHPCVVIPGLGGFIGNEIAGQYSSETNAFSPPSKQISFNSRLTSNDGLLSASITSKTGVSFTEANEIIDFEVKRFLNVPHTRWDFDGVGCLISNADSTIVFQPLTNNNLSNISFGLETIFAIPTQQKQPVIIRFDELKSTKSSFPTIIRTISYTASAAAVMAMIFVGAYQLFPTTNQALLGYIGRTNPSYQPVDIKFTNDIEECPSLLSAKKISLYDYKIVSEDAAGVDLVNDFTESSTQNPELNTISDNFNIVVGAFSNISLANQLVSKLKTEGFAPKLLPSKTSGLIIVSAIGFNSENEAFNFLPKVSALYHEAWVKANW